MDWTGLDYEKIANAIVILVTGLAVGLGLRRGRRESGVASAGPPSLEIAGALVDSSAVRSLESAVKEVKVAIEDGTEENLNYRKSLERGVEDMTEALDELTKGVASLKEEIIRSKR
jgi:hypothetical protein